MRAPAWLAWCALLWALWWPLAAAAQPAQIESVAVSADEPGLAIDFAVRADLPRVVEDALQRGVPLYFEAVAKVYRARWYWRDARVGGASRSWRLSYQPLTSTWRVSSGGLHQSFERLSDAMIAVTRAVRVRLAEPGALDEDARHYVEFTWRLDTSRLPRPMQIGIGGQADWSIEVEHTLPLPKPRP